jgi:hypothetical protein
VAIPDRFPAVVALDTEFCGADRGERHRVVALVARVAVDGREVQTYRFFEDDLSGLRRSPLPAGPDVLYVTFVGQAEWRSFLALGWSLPANSVDLYAEARCLRNLALPYRVLQGLKVRGYGLIDTCRYFGLPAFDPADKEEMRDLILSGGPWSGAERARILDYCGQDVIMTGSLWDRLGPAIPLGQALYRGWFTQAVAAMEDRGIPIDTEARDRLVGDLAGLRRQLLLRFDRFGLCDPDGESIDPDRLMALVAGRDIRWPAPATGKPVRRLKALKARLAPHPELHCVAHLAQGLNDLRGLRSLPVASDGRARAALWPYGTSTGRNNPDGKGFLFQFSRWTRGLIRPEPGRFVCYADWTSQEFAIIAYLSGDPLLIRCYEQPGDPYCNLGATMGLLPAGAGKDHLDRDVIKVVALGMFYGRGAQSIARATRRPVRLIQGIIDEFWTRCPRAERWLESYVDGLFLTDRAWTKFGWTIHRHPLTKATSAANFPVQGNAAEMMRWASCLGYENGVPLCCPIHDAFLCEGRIEDEERVVSTLSACMERASAVVLGGPIVRAQPVVFRHPERFADKKGWRAWSWIMRAVDPAYAVEPARMA